MSAVDASVSDEQLPAVQDDRVPETEAEATYPEIPALVGLDESMRDSDDEYLDASTVNQNPEEEEEDVLEGNFVLLSLCISVVYFFIFL